MDAQNPIIVGHRGASADAPENTLAAFRLAFEQEADGIEGDFYLSGDGQVVCHHDKDTKRTGGRRMFVERTSLERLRSLDFGAWKDKSFAGEKIPTLQQVADSVPQGKTLVIELKSRSQIVEPVIKQLRELDLSGKQVWIISFHTDVVLKCKEALPDVKVHWLTGFDGDRPTPVEIAKTVRQCRADGVGFDGNAAHIDEGFVKRLFAAGVKEFHVWTVDSPDRARQFQAWGAIGITTNVPAVIRRAIYDEAR